MQYNYIASGQAMMSLIHVAMCEDTENKHIVDTV